MAYTHLSNSFLSSCIVDVKKFFGECVGFHSTRNKHCKLFKAKQSYKQEKPQHTFVAKPSGKDKVHVTFFFLQT